MNNIVKHTGGVDRRDFFKLKFFTLLIMFFQKSFGINLLADENHTDYDVLDILLELPFSEETMKEVKFRVNLQKKYSLDANGELHSLKRFFNEIGYFIISNHNLMDFKLLTSINDTQIDRIYYLNKAAQKNDVGIFKDLQSKLLINDSVMDEVLLLAVKSQSFDTSMHLIQQKISLTTQTQETIMELFYREDYDHFYKKISNTSGKLLLPLSQKYNNLKSKRKMQKKVLSFTGDYYFDEFEENLSNIVYNSLVDLYTKDIIDDFSINFNQMKIEIKVWKYSNMYPNDFYDIFEKILKYNGYGEMENYTELLDLSESRLSDNNKYMNRNRFISLADGDTCVNKTDYFDFIRIELL